MEEPQMAWNPYSNSFEHMHVPFWSKVAQSLQFHQFLLFSLQTLLRRAVRPDPKCPWHYLTQPAVMGPPPLLKFCPQLVHDDEGEGQKTLSRCPFPSPVTKAENFQWVAVFSTSVLILNVMLLDLKSERSCSESTPFTFTLSDWTSFMRKVVLFRLPFNWNCFD